MSLEYPPTSGSARRGAAAVAALTLVGALALAGPTVARAHEEYTVRPGDTLDAIARRYGTTVPTLASGNDVRDPDRIVAGTVLRIPAGGGAGGGGAGAGGAGGAAAVGRTLHVVGLGETLSGIALRYGVGVRQLMAWNGLAHPDRVQAGARMSVSGPVAPDLSGSGGGSHVVAPGETLGGIALRSGVTVTELARANGIADPDRIVAGTTLTVPGGWQCPVRGPARFVDDFGVTKPDGRYHDGVDLFAPRGTPVVAPVAGRVEQVTGDRAGLQFTLHGADGHVYVGTHLDSLGAAGRVRAGEVLGTVGTTGNAHGTSPHLHLEIHLDGERLANPYPTLRSACR